MMLPMPQSERSPATRRLPATAPRPLPRPLPPIMRRLLHRWTVALVRTASIRSSLADQASSARGAYPFRSAQASRRKFTDVQKHTSTPLRPQWIRRRAHLEGPRQRCAARRPRRPRPRQRGWRRRASWRRRRVRAPPRPPRPSPLRPPPSREPTRPRCVARASRGATATSSRICGAPPSEAAVTAARLRRRRLLPLLLPPPPPPLPLPLLPLLLLLLLLAGARRLPRRPRRPRRQTARRARLSRTRIWPTLMPRALGPASLAPPRAHG